jgi:hypothetical protein
MNISDAIKNVLAVGGIENVYTRLNPVVDHKFIDENYSVIISEKKYLSLWLIDLNKSVEIPFSLKNNIREDEFTIKGYLGFNYEKDSFSTFSLFAEKISKILRLNPTLNGGCLAITKIGNSEYSKKMFCNILCHYIEITVTLNQLISRKEL